MTKVVKFGGTSLAEAKQFLKVADIIRSDPDRRYVVPSAPGKRFSGDTKVTDMFYACYDSASRGGDFEEIFQKIKNRYNDIISGLGLDMSLEDDFEHIRLNFIGRAGRDYAASRGEYLNGKIVAKLLGFAFIDAADVIFFDESGKYDAKRTIPILRERLSYTEYAVIPGFYGSMPNDTIRTFSRGGSDITGSIVAAAADADLYENWTDVSGFLIADPRVVDNPQVMKTVTYRELRELSYMGASVLHEEAVFPVREAGIPLVIKNTNAPQDPGTIISETADEGEAEPIITGVTGKRGFVAINVARDRTKPRVGFMRRALSVFERYDVSVEHMPTGVDRFGAVVQEQDVHDSLYSLVGDIQQEVEPLEIEVVEGLALIATVGRNLRGRAGISGHLFGMLGQAGVSVRMISQSCDEINIIIGVEEKDFDLAIQTIYRAFSDENGIVKVSDLEAPAPVDPALATLKK